MAGARTSVVILDNPTVAVQLVHIRIQYIRTMYIYKHTHILDMALIVLQ